jgi:hypothetical protein
MGYDLVQLDPGKFAARLAALRRDGAPADFAAALSKLGIITDPDWIAELVFAAYERGRRHFDAQNLYRAPALARAQHGVAKLRAALVALGRYRADLGSLELVGIAQHCRPHVAPDPADLDGAVHILESEIARLMLSVAALNGQRRPKTRLRCFVDALVPLYALLSGNRKTGRTEFVRAACALVVEGTPSETLLRSAVTKSNKQVPAKA